MTRDRETEQWIDRCIGPRQPGTVYRSRYFRERVTVLAVDRNPPDWKAWSVTEATDDELARRTSRTHCTDWDDRNEVLSQPAVTR